MYVESCKQFVKLELLLTDWQNNGHQVTLTVFNLTLVNVAKIDLSISEEKTK